MHTHASNHLQVLYSQQDVLPVHVYIDLLGDLRIQCSHFVYILEAIYNFNTFTSQQFVVFVVTMHTSRGGVEIHAIVHGVHEPGTVP